MNIDMLFMDDGKPYGDCAKDAMKDIIHKSPEIAANEHLIKLIMNALEKCTQTGIKMGMAAQ